MKKIVCPINSKTKAKHECVDCKFRDDCIQDILDDLQRLFSSNAAKAGKDIGNLLKERRGI